MDSERRKRQLDLMECKIGEIFEYNGEWYQCVGGTCRNCSFYYDIVCKNITTIGSTNFGNCHCSLRTDHKSVIFKKLEKFGEPYDFQKRTFQTYKLHTIPFLSEDVELVVIPSKDNNTIEIEIKNKEGMEEDREYSEEEFKNNPRFQHHKNIEQVINMKKMKEFDINLAKQGKPICTRDGRKARIICFDKGGEQPIVALIKNDEEESIDTFFNNGHSVSKTNKVSGDLMMLPEKKEGWVNIYKSDNDKFSAILGSAYVYNTKEEAIDNADPDTTIATVKISWEE